MYICTHACKFCRLPKLDAILLTQQKSRPSTNGKAWSGAKPPTSSNYGVARSIIGVARSLLPHHVSSVKSKGPTRDLQKKVFKLTFSSPAIETRVACDPHDDCLDGDLVLLRIINCLLCNNANSVEIRGRFPRLQNMQWRQGQPLRVPTRALCKPFDKVPTRGLKQAISTPRSGV